MTNFARELAVEYDPFDGLLAGDPYPVYASLRERAPVYFSERRSFWALTRHEDILTATRDWETFSAARGVDIDDTADAYGSGDFLGADPPRHDELRDVVRSRFVPKRIRAQMEEFIRAEVRRLLTRTRGSGPVDLAAELAWPLPVAVGTELLGIPASDRDLLLRLQRQLAERTPGIRELPADARAAGAALRSYFDDLIRSRRGRPGDDVVTSVAGATPAGRPIGDDAVGMLFLLFVASMETTASSIANALVLLAGHPQQHRWLGENIRSVDRAVEEVLRFEAPVQVTKRVATRDVVVQGATIPEGADVFLILASANRDERRYDRPDLFHVRRDPRRHLAFGDGIHHCLGAPLARLELRILFEELCEAGVSIDLQGPSSRLNSHFIRGYSKLPGVLS